MLVFEAPTRQLLPQHHSYMLGTADDGIWPVPRLYTPVSLGTVASVRDLTRSLANHTGREIFIAGPLALRFLFPPPECDILVGNGAEDLEVQARSRWSRCRAWKLNLAPNIVLGVDDAGTGTDRQMKLSTVTALVVLNKSRWENANIQICHHWISCPVNLTQVFLPIALIL